MTEHEDLSFFESDGATDANADSAAVASSVAQYLVFVASKREMAIGLAQVSEIVPYEGVSPVPGTPAYVRGVAHVRGRLIPVIDLALKLGLPSEPNTKRSCILMLDLSLDEQAFPVGIVMDGVATLLDLDTSQIKPPPRFGAGVDVKYLQGLVPTERGTLPLIDFARVFASEELAQIARGVASDQPLTPTTAV
jgi:purine-binding chemotaxis protein CheW